MSVNIVQEVLSSLIGQTIFILLNLPFCKMVTYKCCKNIYRVTYQMAYNCYKKYMLLD